MTRRHPRRAALALALAAPFLTACGPIPQETPSISIDATPVAAISQPPEHDEWDVAAWADLLPWDFAVDSRDGDPVAPSDFPTESCRRFLLTSSRPLDGSGSGSTLLRLTVDQTIYRSAEDAGLVFEAIGASANPDTGLSYAWDLVVLNSNQIFHLNAPCLLSGENFDSIAGLFLESVVSAGDSNTRLLRCRCGGGCRG